MIQQQEMFTQNRRIKKLAQVISTLIFCVATSTIGLTAQEKAVVLMEEKLPKRTVLFAKNNTDQEKNIFLKVNPTGYRRSSSRPIIKTIPARSRVAMITLIPLKDVKASYTYNLIINEEEKAMTVDYSQGEKKQANVADIMENELVIFIKDHCEQCKKLTRMLQEYHVKFRMINVNDRNRFYEYFWNRLEKDGYKKNTVSAPVVVDKGTLRYPITDLESLTKELLANHKL